MLHKFCLFILVAALMFSGACRRTGSEYVTVALGDSFTALDTLTMSGSDSASERVRTLMFNTLIRKSETFDYVGELASEVTVSEDRKTVTLKLRDGIKFHNGNDFTSADVKYTFDTLFESKGYKRGAFFDSVPLAPGETVIGSDGKPAKFKTVQHIVSIDTPDPKTVVFVVSRPALSHQLLANLVAIPIIPQGTSGKQKEHPIGTGPFKFVAQDQSQSTVDFEAFQQYWEGSPKITKLRLKVVKDASALQAELQTGGVDLAPAASNLPPDALNVLKDVPNLKVEQFEGSNIQYVGMNTAGSPLNNVKIRQAIGYAIDRDKIIKELLLGQAKVADSILPIGSYAYSPGTKYQYDPEKAKQLIKEAGYNNEPIKFKYAAGNALFNNYGQAIQSSLAAVGLIVQIETLDPQTIREQLAKGQFNMNTGVWAGGNQDPIFLRDLFTTDRIPGEVVFCCNRSRYSNAEVDKLIENAVEEADREKAKDLYVKAWGLISNDLPLLPLWYPANMVVSNKRIGNIKMNPSGDWTFLKDITVN